MSRKYEWIVVGGGIAGISVAEILTREGHSVCLVDRGSRLAGETTRDFHEWIHTGCLYTLIPDHLLTLKYMLGSIDDLLEYYSSFERMNLVPTERGLDVGSAGWFSPNYIHFRYKLRRMNAAWSFVTARSMYLIERIASHDWLRRRAGMVDEFRIEKWATIARNLYRIWRGTGEFISIKTTDLTSNSRLVLRDLVATSLHNGLDLRIGTGVLRIEERNNKQIVVTDQETLQAENVILCAGRKIADFVNVSLKTSYAPMAVVDGLDVNAASFVDLDYFTKACVNLIVKDNGIGLAGGISLDQRSLCDAYLDYVIRRHKVYQPNIRLVGKYVGMKNEITFPGQDRNYLFHIVNCRPGLWAAVPGKFTLAFSLAPEFYRRVYHRNPRKFFSAVTDSGQSTTLVAETRWHDMVHEHSLARSRLVARTPDNDESSLPGLHPGGDLLTG